MEEGFNNQISQFQYANSPLYNWTNDEIICLTENVLFGYNQFFKVALPVSFIISKINDIKAMLQVPEFNAYWKQIAIIPSTPQLQQSQE